MGGRFRAGCTALTTGPVDAGGSCGGGGGESGMTGGGTAWAGGAMGSDGSGDSCGGSAGGDRGSSGGGETGGSTGGGTGGGGAGPCLGAGGRWLGRACSGSAVPLPLQRRPMLTHQVRVIGWEQEVMAPAVNLRVGEGLERRAAAAKATAAAVARAAVAAKSPALLLPRWLSPAPLAASLLVAPVQHRSAAAVAGCHALRQPALPPLAAETAVRPAGHMPATEILNMTSDEQRLPIELEDGGACSVCAAAVGRGKHAQPAVAAPAPRPPAPALIGASPGNCNLS